MPLPFLLLPLLRSRSWARQEMRVDRRRFVAMRVELVLQEE